MHLATPQAVVVPVTETGVRELSVERPQLGQIEKKLWSLIDGSQEPDQPARLACRGISPYGSSMVGNASIARAMIDKISWFSTDGEFQRSPAGGNSGAAYRP